VYCEGGEEQDHFEDQRTETDAEGPERALDDREVSLPHRVDVLGQRGVSLPERRFRECEVRIQLRALDSEADFAAGSPTASIARPPTNEVTIEEAVNSVADRARMSLRTSRWRSSESSARSKASSSTLAATA
jgi:hypothetical protein